MNNSTDMNVNSTVTVNKIQIPTTVVTKDKSINYTGNLSTNSTINLRSNRNSTKKSKFNMILNRTLSDSILNKKSSVSYYNNHKVKFCIFLNRGN